MGDQNENSITNEKKKVYINCDGYYPQCPTCQHFDLDINKDREKCSKCGQLLDWDDLLDLIRKDEIEYENRNDDTER